MATQPFDYLKNGKKSGFKSLGSALKIDRKLFIDKEKIVPDASIAEEHTSKLKEILGAFV